MHRMFQLAMASCLASLATIAVVCWTWPVPVIEVPVEGNSGGKFVVANYAYKDSGIPENTLRFWLKWVIYRDGRVGSYSGTPPLNYIFVNCDTGEKKGPWNPVLGSERHRLARERFDFKGRVLIEEGPADQFGVVTPKFVHRVDPATLQYETFSVPSGGDIIGHKICSDGSKLIRFHGGFNKPLRIELIDMEDMSTLINAIEFPDRLGYVERWRHQVATAMYDISTDGEQIVMTESWQQQTRMTPPGVETWDLVTGEMTHRFNLVEEDPDTQRERPKIVADKHQDTYPVKSDRLGHHWPRLKMIDGQQHVLVNTSIRKKYQEGNAWQMMGNHSRLTCFNQETGRTQLWKEIGYPKFNDEPKSFSYPMMECAAVDGSRQLWLTDFPRWRQKTGMLTDSNLEPVSDWFKFPFSIADSGADHLGGYPFPDRNMIYLQPFMDEVSLPGFQDNWWDLLPEPISWPRPKFTKSHYGVGSPRAVTFDFDKEQFLVFRRLKSNLHLGTPVCQRDRIVLLLKKSFRNRDEPAAYSENPRIEVWDVPIRQPAFGKAAVIGLATFVFCLLASQFIVSDAGLIKKVLVKHSLLHPSQPT